jgi:predicted HTH domain antitoxin
MLGDYTFPVTVTLNLPDGPAARRWTEAELRLELACAMHARGQLSKVAGAEMAGVDFFSFQEALAERGIDQYSVDDLHDEVAALREGFPSVETLQPGR